jgi:hypothetical protein
MLYRELPLGFKGIGKIFWVLVLTDVDTPEPDEKSLITYISSLYDVFPEPPPIHPLYDPVSNKFM